MMFQNKEDIPHAVWGNPNPKKPNFVLSRYVDWTSWFAGEQQWGESSIRQGESSGTITHEISHNIFSVGDNNNNPYVTPYHRVGSGTWDMMDRGSFNGPGGPHNRWQVPAQYGASMGAEHTLRSKVGMGFVPNSSVLRVNRDGLAQSGLAVADVVARAVNAEPQPAGIRSGIQVFLDGAAPVDKEPACDVNTNPLCDGGGPSGLWTNYSLETVQRIGYGSFEPDNGVLIAKNKAWAAGATRGTEGSQCGYNCFTWVEDAHPADMNAVDYYKPDGTPIMRTVADYRQLNDALFHAGTGSGSQYEFGYWPRELLYEFLKDWKAYVIFLLIIHFYRLLLLRLQGEARLLAAPDTGTPVEAIEKPERFLVRKLGTEFLVSARDIEWLEAAENYVNLHVRGRAYPLRSTMAAIQDRLDPQQFVRVHRSYIVNLGFLEQIEPLETGDARLVLKGGARIPCSRRYRAALRGAT